MLPQEQVRGLIPTIQELTIDSIRLQAMIADKESELKNSELSKAIQYLNSRLKECQDQEQTLRENGKMLMLANGLKKIEMVDGTVIQLDSTRGSIKIAEGVKLDKKYYTQPKTPDPTLNKVLITKDFNAGLITDPGVTIESSYNFVIKSK